MLPAMTFDGVIRWENVGPGIQKGVVVDAVTLQAVKGLCKLSPSFLSLTLTNERSFPCNVQIDARSLGTSLPPVESVPSRGTRLAPLPLAALSPQDRKVPVPPPRTHPRPIKRLSGSKEKEKEPLKKAKRNKEVSALPGHPLAKSFVPSADNNRVPVPAGSHGQTQVAQACAPKEQAAVKVGGVDLEEVAFPSFSHKSFSSHMLLDSGALNGVNVISTKLASTLISLGLATAVEGSVAKLCGCFHSCKLSSEKICFSFGFLSSRLDSLGKKIEKQISLEAYVADTGIADFIVGRESIKHHSYVKWLSQRFYKISQATADAYGLEPMEFPRKGRHEPSLGSPAVLDPGSDSFPTDTRLSAMATSEGTTSQVVHTASQAVHTTSPVVHTTVPVVHSLPVSDDVTSFPDVSPPLHPLDVPCHSTGGFRESVCTAGCSRAGQGLVALIVSKKELLTEIFQTMMRSKPRPFSLKKLRGSRT